MFHYLVDAIEDLVDLRLRVIQEEPQHGDSARWHEEICDERLKIVRRLRENFDSHIFDILHPDR